MDETSHRLLTLLQIRDFVDLFVRDRQAKAVAECLQRSSTHFFLLVSNILRLARFPHTIAFDGFGKYQGRLPYMPCRSGVSGIDFMWIVTTAIQTPDVIVGHIGDHLKQFRVFAEKMLTHVGTISGLESLVFPVNTFHHALL